MRVFKKYDFNIAPFCRFTEDYVQIERFLKENGLEYNGSLFRYEELSNFQNSIDKIITKYPEMKGFLWSFKEYGSERSIISNCDYDWTPRDDKDSTTLARLLSAKIPRPYNPCSVCLC